MNKHTTYKKLIESTESKNGIIFKVNNILNDDYLEELYVYDDITKDFINGDRESIHTFYQNKQDLDELSINIVSSYSSEEYVSPMQLLAMYRIKKKMEQEYIELLMALDNCQGCTTNLDEKLSELKVYENLLKKLRM